MKHATARERGCGAASAAGWDASPLLWQWTAVALDAVGSRFVASAIVCCGDDTEASFRVAAVTGAASQVAQNGAGTDPGRIVRRATDDFALAPGSREPPPIAAGPTALLRGTLIIAAGITSPDGVPLLSP